MSGGLTSWFLGTSQLDDAVDKATSELLPSGSEDIALNLEICDQIRSKAVPAKDAMKALKRRMNHKNPNVQLLTLSLTDTCVKNGGDQFLSEVASREFMDNLVSILKIPALNLDVKNTTLRLVQNWSVAFEGKPSLGYVGQVYRTLVNEGFKFPPKDLTVANSAMVDTQTAPEWIDSEVCLRCRTAFTFTNRKHHCRNCGQVFDQQCSSKALPLPHFGIAQEVRVCDGCFNKLTRKPERDKAQRHTGHSQPDRHRPARDLDDAELQRAIQLSLEEVNAAKRGYTPSQPPSSSYYSEPPIVERQRVRFAQQDEEDDPDLRAAIEASLREASAPKPSAPVVSENSRYDDSQPSYYGDHNHTQTVPVSNADLPHLPNYDLDSLETDAILTFSQTVEQVQAQGGRDLSRYPAVTALYDKANGLRPKLALSLDDTSRKEEMLTEMHTKLSEAVQLYDKLLTEQLAYPRWRAPQAPAPLHHQQVESAPTQLPSWNYAQSSSPQIQVSSPAPLSTYQPSYPAEVAQPQWSHTQYAQVAPNAQQYAISSVTLPSEHLPPVSVPYVHAAYQQFNSQPVPASTVVPPVQVPVSAPPVPVAMMSPPTQPPPPLLSRRSTLAHAPSSASHIQLSRSNTVTHSPSQVPRPSVQSQYPVPPPVLPQFPSAPTTIPQGFPMYGSGIPVGVAQTEERKEALLIDL